MATQQDFSFETLMKPGREAFEYWISFFPTAPMFGVRWRFEDMTQGFGGAFGAPVAPKAKAAPTPAPKAAVKTPADVETTATVTAKTKAAPKPVTKAADTPAPKAEVKAAAPVAAPAKKAATKPAKTSKPRKSGVPAGLMTSAPAKPDDLKLIKGIGPGLETQLNGLGIYTFAQLSGFSKADLTWVDTNLTAFKGRCFRDDWVGQAKALMG